MQINSKSMSQSLYKVD